MTPHSPVHIIRRLAGAFESLGVRYLIGGSVASMMYGLPPFPDDVAFVAELNRSHVRPLVEALQEEFYIDEVMIREAIAQRDSFNVIHLESMDKADVFVARADPWGQAQMQRRLEAYPDPEDPTFAAYFSSAEDTVLSKLRWYRMGGGVSERQWNDILGVLKVQADALDRAYLEHWAADLKLADLLERALDEAGLA